MSVQDSPFRLDRVIEKLATSDEVTLTVEDRVIEKLATSDEVTLTVEDRVIEKLATSDAGRQNARHVKQLGRGEGVHFARKDRHPDEWTVPSRPMTRTGPALRCSMT
jgi:hypothetical protein